MAVAGVLLAGVAQADDQPGLPRVSGLVLRPPRACTGGSGLDTLRGGGRLGRA